MSVAFFHNGILRPYVRLSSLTQNSPLSVGQAGKPDLQESVIVAQHKTSSKTSGQRRTATKSMKKTASRPTRRVLTKREATLSTACVADEEVSIDRRRLARRDDVAELVPPATAGAPQLERRKKVNRRRQIDPTTCERDYTDQEVEFMNALDDYKRKSGRMFPTCSEVLEVLRGLGYVKLSAAELGARPEDNSYAASAKPMPSDWPASISSVEEGDESADLGREPQLAY